MGVLRTAMAATLLAVAGCSTSVTLYSFSGGSDGGNPSGGLIADAAGNFDGVTFQGGKTNFGTVFQVTPSGTLTVLYSFASLGDPIADGADGANPYAGLVAVAGNLYGTTYQGGGNPIPPGGPYPGCNIAFGCGTVFQVTPSGGEAVLHRFTSDEGAHPHAGLIADTAGNLYGTTYEGGATTSCDIPFGCGTVFQLTRSGTLWTLKVLHTFTGPPGDGRHPYAGLVVDAANNLYGTTYQGGTSDAGTVFQLTPSGNLNVLHSFVGDRSEGRLPYAGLIADAKGNLYGTTTMGGAGDAGTVFQLTPPSPTMPVWTLQTLHSFNGDVSEGVYPYAGVIADASANLWGSTSQGGPMKPLGAPGGTVFQLTPSGTFNVAYGFSGTSDGSDPSGVIMNADGFLDGTTSGGGVNGCSTGCGTIFQLPFASISFTPASR